MARRRVIVSPEAELEGRSAFLWYLERNAEVADRFEAVLSDAITGLVDAPEQNPEIEAGMRRLLLRRFPYGVLYTVEVDTVLVLAVMHLRRRPGYWRSRRR